MPFRNRGRQIITSNCGQIYKPTWNQICTGDFPEDVENKYGGYLMEEGDPYSAFNVENSPTTVLLTFRTKDFEKCITLKLLNATTYKCVQGSGVPTNIVYPSSRIRCIDDGLLMADELIAACSSISGLINTFTAIIYADSEDPIGEGVRYNGKCSNYSSNIWIMLVLMLILLLVIYRLR